MRKYILISLLFLTAAACDQTEDENSDLNDRKEKIEEFEKSSFTDEQINRKNQSLDFCKTYSIPTSDNLPCIQKEEDVNIRSKDEVIQRALALSYLGLKSEDLEQEHLLEYDKKYDISKYFTDIEKSYVNSESPSEQQQINANWRYESLHVLLWSLGYIDSLIYPSDMCNVGEDIQIIFNRTREEFVKDAKLRTKKEILNQADLIYRIHWACVDARINGKEPPSNLNPSIVYERHYALNWLINYMNQDWDHISTDT